MSTYAQKSATVDPGETVNTSGTTPETMPGKVPESAVVRLLTGKLSTTWEPPPHHPRTNSPQAAVITDDRRIFKASANSWTRPTSEESNRTESETESRPSADCEGLYRDSLSGGRFPLQYAESAVYSSDASYSASQSTRSCSEPKKAGGTGASEISAE